MQANFILWKWFCVAVHVYTVLGFAFFPFWPVSHRPHPSTTNVCEPHQPALDALGGSRLLGQESNRGLAACKAAGAGGCPAGGQGVEKGSRLPVLHAPSLCSCRKFIFPEVLPWDPFPASPFLPVLPHERGSLTLLLFVRDEKVTLLPASVPKPLGTH